MPYFRPAGRLGNVPTFSSNPQPPNVSRHCTPNINIAFMKESAIYTYYKKKKSNK